MENNNDSFASGLSSLKMRSMIGIVGAVVCGILGFVLMRFHIALGFLGFAGAVGMIVYSSRISKQLRDFTTPIRRSVLEEKLDLESYDTSGHFPKDLVKSTKLFTGWSSISGSDLVAGRYQGIPIRFCDLKLTHEESDGNDHTRTVTDFSGTFLELTCDRTIEGEVRVKEQHKGIFTRKVVETENEAFNKQFTVTADNPQEVFYILTPQFMETIVKADAYADAKTQILFRENKIYIGLYNSKDLFEGRGEKTQEGYRSSCQKDLQYITDFLDIMRLNTALFHG